MSSEQAPELHAQLHALQAENHALRRELEAARQAEAAWRSRRTESIKLGGRLLLPLLDRHKVARSFQRLATTLSLFAGPREHWPEQPRIVQEARELMESWVRFGIRRRTLFAFFSIIAAAIPFIQVWLVVQQNRIIENQAKFSEIQVYDIVARSMTEGDRNARLMTGALLSRAELEFLHGVVDEAFSRDLATLHGREGVSAASRRLTDAAFRGPLIRAVVRSVEIRVDQAPTAELAAQAVPMLLQIVRDAEERVPAVLRLADRNEAPDPELAEQVDYYLVNVGEALRVLWQLRPSAPDRAALDAALTSFLARVAEQPLPQHHVEAYRTALESLLVTAGLEPPLGQDIDWSRAEIDREAATQRGVASLRQTLGEDRVAWNKLAAPLQPR